MSEEEIKREVVLKFTKEIGEKICSNCDIDDDERCCFACKEDGGYFGIEPDADHVYMDVGKYTIKISTDDKKIIEEKKYNNLKEKYAGDELFHSTDGCLLPRGERSPVCLIFLCEDGIKRMLDKYNIDYNALVPVICDSLIDNDYEIEEGDLDIYE